MTGLSPTDFKAAIVTINLALISEINIDDQYGYDSITSALNNIGIFITTTQANNPALDQIKATLIKLEASLSNDENEEKSFSFPPPGGSNYNADAINKNTLINHVAQTIRLLNLQDKREPDEIRKYIGYHEEALQAGFKLLNENKDKFKNNELDEKLSEFVRQYAKDQIEQYTQANEQQAGIPVVLFRKSSLQDIGSYTFFATSYKTNSFDGVEHDLIVYDRSTQKWHSTSAMNWHGREYLNKAGVFIMKDRPYDSFAQYLTKYSKFTVIPKPQIDAVKSYVANNYLSLK